MTRPACCVCGEHEGARTLTPDERAAWPWLAGRIAVVCAQCRRRFRRSEEWYAGNAA